MKPATTPGAGHTAERGLCFDGFGINGPDEYRSRLATLTEAGHAAGIGPLLARAPELLAEREALREQVRALSAALERTLSWLTSYPGGGATGKGGPYEQARAALSLAAAESPERAK